ncbi:hypothetical protein [Kitasatospora sp. LaBMicrA B282]|uniref:hypothetical protein n=1 Tax=Kitasatospora sp. LaBMicrA B282 TaxID=3420949 RepID=UPI003D13AD73
MPEQRRGRGVRFAGPRVLAAGGAVLAQMWGLGIGVGAAHATTGAPAGPAVRSVGASSAHGAAGRAPQDVPEAHPVGAGPSGSTSTGTGTGQTGSAGVSGVLGAAGAAGLEAGGQDVDQLLHDRIRTGGLPLPGQANTVPDAFALADTLLPSDPAHGRTPEGAAVATGGEHGELPGSSAARVGRGADGNGSAADRTAPVAGGRGDRGAEADEGNLPQSDGAGGTGGTADGVSEIAASARNVEPAASRDNGRTAVGRAARAGTTTPDVLNAPVVVPGIDSSLTGLTDASGTTAAEPLAATGTENAVLIPIAAGLLLTGAAMYKHRGLPRGH